MLWRWDLLCMSRSSVVLPAEPFWPWAEPSAIWQNPWQNSFALFNLTKKYGDRLVSLSR